MVPVLKYMSLAEAELAAGLIGMERLGEEVGRELAWKEGATRWLREGERRQGKHESENPHACCDTYVDGLGKKKKSKTGNGGKTIEVLNINPGGLGVAACLCSFCK